MLLKLTQRFKKIIRWLVEPVGYVEPFHEETQRTLDENLQHFREYGVYVDRDGNAHLNTYNKDVQKRVKQYMKELR